MKTPPPKKVLKKLPPRRKPAPVIVDMEAIRANAREKAAAMEQSRARQAFALMKHYGLIDSTQKMPPLKRRTTEEPKKLPPPRKVSWMR